MRSTKGVLAILLATLAASAAASVARSGEELRNTTPAATQCPTVTVSCPDMGGFDPVAFKASLSGADPAVTPAFKWTVPGARILSGQGTHTITVEPPVEASEVVATVAVNGYDPACLLKTSCTTYFIRDPMPRRVGEYGNIKLKDEKAWIEKFAVELQNDPTAQGYLVCYGGRRSRVGEAQRRCDRAKKYASTYFRGIDAMRLVTMDAGYREQPAVELWVVPSGANSPQASPTVDPQEVRPPTTPRKAHKRNRR